MGKFAKNLAQSLTSHYFARLPRPPDKAFVERFIGSLNRECLQKYDPAQTVAGQQVIIDEWLDKYHSYRPYNSLDLLTPDEFEAQYFESKYLTSIEFQSKIKVTQVSAM